MRSNKKGFTLIEVLLVLAILSILAGIVIVAISPAKQLRQAANAQRRADTNTILNAVYQYAIENGGALPPSIAAMSPGTPPREICKVGATCTDVEGAVSEVRINLAADLVPRYIADMPEDPLGASCSEDDPVVHATDPDNTVCYQVELIVGAPGEPNRVAIHAPDFVNEDDGATIGYSVIR